jgi:hypothetical protein
MGQTCCSRWLNLIRDQQPQTTDCRLRTRDILTSVPRALPSALRPSIAQRFFPFLGAGQCFLLDRDRIAPGILYLLGLDSVELGVFSELWREISFRVDGVHGANLDACRAINALIRVNDELVIQFVEASDRAHLHAIGKLASVAFLGDDVGHRVRVVMGWLKKARNAGSVNANYKIHDGNAQLSVIGYHLSVI